MKIDNLHYNIRQDLWVPVDYIKLVPHQGHFLGIPYYKDKIINNDFIFIYNNWNKEMVKSYLGELNTFYISTDPIVTENDDPYNIWRMNDIDPCPFCGCKDVNLYIMDIKEDPSPLHVCDRCGANGPTDGVSCWRARMGMKTMSLDEILNVNLHSLSPDELKIAKENIKILEDIYNKEKEI